VPGRVPVGAVIVSVEVPDPPATRVTLVALNEVVSPAGEEEAVRLMVPAKLFRLCRVIVEVAEVPTGRLGIVLGLAAMLKSGLVP